MFTEEVGIDPRLDDAAPVYRARVAELDAPVAGVRPARGGDVVYKAEYRALSAGRADPGVWVHPDRVARTSARGGTAAVADRRARSRRTARL